MYLELTSHEARVLSTEVRRRLDDLQAELVHTERRDLRARISDEREMLERLWRRLEQLVRLEARPEENIV